MCVIALVPLVKFEQQLKSILREKAKVVRFRYWYYISSVLRNLSQNCKKSYLKCCLTEIWCQNSYVTFVTVLQWLSIMRRNWITVSKMATITTDCLLGKRQTNNKENHFQQNYVETHSPPLLYVCIYVWYVQYAFTYVVLVLIPLV